LREKRSNTNPPTPTSAGTHTHTHSRARALTCTLTHAPSRAHTPSHPLPPGILDLSLPPSFPPSLAPALSFPRVCQLRSAAGQNSSSFPGIRELPLFLPSGRREAARSLHPCAAAKAESLFLQLLLFPSWFLFLFLFCTGVG
jgi:hypothetical protein